MVAAPPRPARRTRRDGLPENIDFYDTGCEVSQSCLECPLEWCRYDLPDNLRTYRSAEREMEAKRLRNDENASIDEIAATMRISRRTVFRMLAR